MSAPAGPSYPSDGHIYRKPTPNDTPSFGAPSLVNGMRSPPLADGRHIQDLDAEVKWRIHSLQGASIDKILQQANMGYVMADSYLRARQRDHAYVEFAIAYDLVMVQVKRSPEYPTMISSPSSQRYQTAKSLGNKLVAVKDQYKSIRDIIVNENRRNGVAAYEPVTTPAFSPSNSRPSSRQNVQMPEVTSSGQNINGFTSSRPQSMAPPALVGLPSSPRSKPTLKPKPESLHGKSLSERFAALRTSAGSPSGLGPGEDPVRMPSPADFQTNSRPTSVTGAEYPSSLRPAGPRAMPALTPSESSGPARPPKLPLDTSTASGLPRPPSPTYSPARNMQTPGSIAPPRTTPRSIVGTGGRASSAAYSRPPGSDYENGSYFPRTNGGLNTGAESRRKGVVGIPIERSITAERLYDFLNLYSILLIDVRSRREFDQGHIDSPSIICVEPLQLRTGISASDIESSLSISPDAEERLFSARDDYNLVVYYDQSTSTTSFLNNIKNEQDEKLRILHEALMDYNLDKPLKTAPMLLAGGINAWAELLGQAALLTSNTQAGRQTYRRPSAVPALSSSLSVGKKRRDWNPLDAEEERQWLEQARTESVHVQEIPEEGPTGETGEVQDPESDAHFYRTREDFLRRYPAVSLEQESMVAPSLSRFSSDSQYSSPPQTRPVSYAGYEQNATAANHQYNHHEMPMRPAPAAPRTNYSGAHDRNSLQHYNGSRARNLAPYISPQEKAWNVRLPKTGLMNFGTTCYMNSVIQCLSATIPLTMRFQDGSYKKWLQRDNWKGSRGLLPEHYANLISNLWLNDVQACRPMTFRRFCARLNSEWGTDTHQDANDFYVFVMEYLHEDLNVYWRNPPAHVLSTDEEVARERLPMFLAASIEWDRWSKRERSLISDMFAGQHASQLRCLTCGKTSTTYEPWFNLSIEIPPKGTARLQDCLASYCREERLGKGHEWCCPSCKKTRDATKRITLTKAPPYLVVHFKRFHADAAGNARKVATVVDFPLAGLDLAPYMLDPPSDKELASTSRQLDQSMLGPFRYNAYAVVEHFGKGLQYGHYIAYVNDRPRNVWRKFDDSSVTDLQTIKPTGAYLVFYERVDR